MNPIYRLPNYSTWPRCRLYSGQFRVYGYNDWYISSSLWSAGDSYVWIMEKDLGGTDMLQVWVNNTLYANTYNAGAGGLLVNYDLAGNKYRNHRLDGLTLGSYSTSYFDGDIAELIMYDRKLTAPETANINAYLKDKYNLW